MRRKITMVPFGNMASVCRPQKVSSSTCSRPQLSQSGTIGSLTDDYVSEATSPVNGAERHIVELLNNGDTSYDIATQALDEIWQ